jgi:uncharacterized protein (UPF0335 family)
LSGARFTISEPARLPDLIERIERLEEEKRALGEDIKEV